ncbi:fumarylpyruvate hydrolase [Tepidamorphus gemmatus]|uniref:Fumarylpyruvate hydrolase n=2 Tax=Tepidamorphus gemmatus TaxID=747076 RepID=A0A4R3MHX2_9HYPH|nr:fumarylpyruvate hydrolase [Tepidamorphus gemmatus]
MSGPPAMTLDDRAMTDFVFPPPAPPSVAVEGTRERFPVRRILCVGRNYAAHARELGNDPDREPPFFFLKPADCVVDSGATVPYPGLTTNLHHEIELVVAIGRGGSDIPAGLAHEHVYGYAAGIDLTRRDLQEEAKRLRRPWDWSKGFDQSAPCGPIRPVARAGHPSRGRITLAVGDEVRQDADLSEMIWGVAEIVSLASQAMALCPGDLIFTGTPAGVGPIERGDRVTGEIEGVGRIEISIG